MSDKILVTGATGNAATELYLAQSGMPFTILRPNFFMQNTLGFAGTIASEGKFYGSMKDGRAGFVDVRDVGAVAAHAVAGAGHEGKTYVVTAPETLSYTDIAQKLSAVLQSKAPSLDMRRDALIQARPGGCRPIWRARGLAELYDWAGQGAASGVPDEGPRKASAQRQCTTALQAL